MLSSGFYRSEKPHRWANQERSVCKVGKPIVGIAVLLVI